MAAVSTAFALILDDLAGVEVWVAAASFCLAWGLGYVVLPVPSGLGVREAVLIAALPGVVAGSLLAASVAQRLLTLVAEAVMTGVAHGRGLAARRLARPAAEMGHDAPVVDSAPT
jgi:uncharacterized membrane protein YbhN (UPF0104 family)